MRIPRFRFTIRRVMVAVAIVGLFLGMERLLYDLADALLGDSQRQIHQPLVASAWLFLNCLFVVAALRFGRGRRYTPK